MHGTRLTSGLLPAASTLGCTPHVNTEWSEDNPCWVRMDTRYRRTYVLHKRCGTAPLLVIGRPRWMSTIQDVVAANVASVDRAREDTPYVDLDQPPSSTANATASLENSSICSKLNSSEMSYRLAHADVSVTACGYVGNTLTRWSCGCTDGWILQKWPLCKCEYG